MQLELHFCVGRACCVENISRSFVEGDFGFWSSFIVADREGVLIGSSIANVFYEKEREKARNWPVRELRATKHEPLT